MLPLMWKFHEADALLDRLTMPEFSRQYAFLFGAALTAPYPPGFPGVHGVSGVIELIREHYQRNFPHALPKLDEQIAVAKNPYQAAFNHLQGRGSADAANAIIRRAVSPAYIGAEPPDPRDSAAWTKRERDLDGWHLPPWLQALGILHANSPAQLAQLVLTTNFDPLIQVAIRRAGGQTRTSVLSRDGALDQNHGEECHVIHLHGHFTAADTLHTDVQLRHPRPQLKDSLRRILENKAIVVLGYGGWDDVFLQALGELLSVGGKTEILWAFHDSDAANIERQSRELLERLKPGHERGHVTFYLGVNLRELLPQMQQRLLPGMAIDVGRAVAVPSSTHLRQSTASPETAVATRAEHELDSPRPACGWSNFNLLRHPSGTFVGRDEELRELSQCILGTQGRVGIVTGPGGIGKSSLLYRLWQEHGHRFRSALVIDCIGGSSAAEILAQISSWLVSCGNSALATAMQNEQIPLWDKVPIAVHALEQAGPCLLALDNFESALKVSSAGSVPKDKTVAHLLSALAQGLQNSKLLIASDVRFAIDAPAGAVFIVPLYDLSLHEAAYLMQRLPRLGRVGTEADYVALWQAGVRSPRHIDLVEAELKDYELDVVKAALDNRLHDDMVTATHLERIYAKLPAAAQTLLRRAAVYVAPVFHEMLLVHFPNAANDFHPLIQALLDRSLINTIDVKLVDRVRKLYRMHETTRQWALQKLQIVEGDAGVKQAHRIGGYAYLRALVAAPEQTPLLYVLPACQLFQLAGDIDTAGQLTVMLAGALQRCIHPDFARSVLDEVLSSVRGKAEHWQIEAACLRQLGKIDCRQTYYDNAQSRIEQALALGRSHADRSIEAMSLSDLSTVCRVQGRLAEGRLLAVQSLEMSKELDIPRCLAASLCAMAFVERASLNFEEAIRYYFQALETAQSGIPDDPTKKMEPLPEKNYSDHQVLERSLLILRTSDDVSSLVHMLGGLSELVVIDLFLRAPSLERDELLSRLFGTCDMLLAMVAKHGDAVAQSHLLAVKGLLEQQRGNSEDFKTMLLKSIEIGTALGERDTLAGKIGMLAALEEQLAHYEEARDLYSKALAIADQLPNKVPALLFRFRFAWIENQLQRPEQARKHYLQAIDECTTLGETSELITPLRAGLLVGLIEVDRKLGRYEDAERWAHERSQIIEDLAAREAAQGHHLVAQQIRELMLKIV